MAGDRRMTIFKIRLYRVYHATILIYHQYNVTCHMIFFTWKPIFDVTVIGRGDLWEGQITRRSTLRRQVSEASSSIKYKPCLIDFQSKKVVYLDCFEGRGKRHSNNSFDLAARYSSSPVFVL